MTYALVPHDVSASEASIWVGLIDEGLAPTGVELRVGANSLPLASPWTNWTSMNGQFQMAYQRVAVSGLPPRSTHPLVLVHEGEVKATGRVTTLPSTLPTLIDKPFTVLLGSCFFRPNDAEGNVGRTYYHLPSGERPDLKILNGDQVRVHI